MLYGYFLYFTESKQRHSQAAVGTGSPFRTLHVLYTYILLYRIASIVYKASFALYRRHIPLIQKQHVNTYVLTLCYIYIYMYVHII